MSYKIKRAAAAIPFGNFRVLPPCICLYTEFPKPAGDTIITMQCTPVCMWLMLGILCAVLVPVAVYGQSEMPPYLEDAPGGVAVWTATQYVERGTTITIHGYGTTGPVTMLVLNPNDNLADVIQLEDGGHFSVDLDTGGDYWKLDGWYRLTAKAGPESETFPLVLGVGVQCDDGFIPVDAGSEGVHCMMAKGVLAATLDPPSRMMYLYVAEGGATLDIPRYMLDSKSGEADSAFGIIRGNKTISYEEVAVYDDSRIIMIHDAGWVSISGTHAIPEFGMVVVSLAAAGTAIALPRLAGRISH